jgi:hypothetical protein
MDISVPAKKKLPMSYILGAAAVLLVVVAFIVWPKSSKGTETSAKVNTQSKQDGNPKDDITDGLDRIEDEDEDGEPKPVTKPKKEVNEKTPLQKAEEAVTEAEEELEDLRGKYGVKGDPKKDCSKNCGDSTSNAECVTKFKNAKLKLQRAQNAFEEEKNKNPKKK